MCVKNYYYIPSVKFHFLSSDWANVPRVSVQKSQLMAAGNNIFIFPREKYKTGIR